MSEQGWRAFLSADGVDDWVILHGGPTAVFGPHAGGRRGRWANRRRLRRTRRMDPGGPGRQQGLYRRLARWGSDPESDEPA